MLAAAHRLADGQGLEVRIGGSAAGVLHAGLAADADPAALATLVEGLRAATASYDGTSPSSPHRPRSAPSSTRGARCPAWT